MTARLRAMLPRTITCRRSAPSAPIRLTCAMTSAQASWFAPTVAPLIRRFSVRGQPYRGRDTAAAPTTTTSADPRGDGFIAALDNDGIPHGDREQTVHSAGRVCNYLGAGRGVTGAIVGVSIGNPPMNLIDAQNFVAIARAYYCPD
jgi:hypothetical protein